MKLIDNAFWYEIQGHKMHFAAAQGHPIAKALKRRGDLQIIATVAVEVNGHILVWILQSNDVDLFNRLLDSKVSFSAEASPQALFPEHLH